MAKDSRIYGIHLTDQAATFASLDPNRDSEPKTVPKSLTASIWQLLDSGPASDQAPLSETIGQLEHAADTIDAFRGPLDEFLKSVRRPAHAIGLTVPYFSTPITRRIAKDALLSGVKDICDENPFLRCPSYRIHLVETPIAVALACRNEFQGKCLGVFLPGRGGCWEATVIQASPTEISVEDCLEVRPGAGEAKWDRRSEQAVPEWWVAPDVRSETLLQEVLSANPWANSQIKVQSDLEKMAAIGAAQFAGAMEKTPIVIKRIFPRSIGILGGNSKSEPFWKCLVSAGAADPIPEIRLSVKSQSTESPPVVLLAALADEATGAVWLSVLPRKPDESPQLFWWDEPYPLAPSPEADTQVLSLNIVSDSMGQRVRDATLGDGRVKAVSSLQPTR